MQLWSWLKVTKLRDVSDMAAAGRRRDAIRGCRRLRGRGRGQSAVRLLVGSSRGDEKRGESGLARGLLQSNAVAKIPIKCDCAC
jgi:hypothetical protein